MECGQKSSRMLSYLAFKPSWDSQGSLFITQTIVNNLVTDIEKSTVGRSHDLCITIWSAKAKNSLELQYGWNIASNALRNWNFRAIAITVCLLWLKYLSCTLRYLQYSLPSGHKIFWMNKWLNIKWLNSYLQIWVVLKSYLCAFKRNFQA